MELRWLTAFVSVVDHGGFRAAAQAEHVAQPALSRQIQALERSLGVTLFVRGASGARPTEAGRALYDEVQPLLRQVRAATDAVRADAGEARPLQVGYLPPAVRGPVPDLVNRLRAALPRVQVELHELEGGPIIEGVRAHTLDIGLLILDRVPDGDPVLAAAPLVELQYVVAVSTAHRLGRRRVVDLADLDGDVFVSFDEDEPVHAAILALVREHCPGSPVQQAFGFGQAYGLLTSGVGFAALPPLAGDPTVPHVRLLRTRPALPTATLGVVTRRRWRSPALPVVREFARSWAARG